MSDEAAASISKLIPYGKKLTPKFSILDGDLKIHVPNVQEALKINENKSFQNVLQKYVGQVNDLQHDADLQIQRMVAGETEDLHEVTMAMEEAETSFELMMEIRNQLVDAYKELHRMQ